MPDWSYIPEVKAVGVLYAFSADDTQTQAVCEFKGERRSKLQISADYLGTIETHGVAVGTLCRSGDYLMAFLHWRALILKHFPRADEKRRAEALDDFCLTLSLGIKDETLGTWMDICHHVFATLISTKLPELAPLRGPFRPRRQRGERGRPRRLPAFPLQVLWLAHDGPLLLHHGWGAQGPRVRVYGMPRHSRRAVRVLHSHHHPPGWGRVLVRG